MRAPLLAAILLCLGAVPALAECDKPVKGEGPPGSNVEMPNLMAPLTQDGKLFGYAYISSKLVAASPTFALQLREKLAFMQDAFVRDVNGAPVQQAGEPPTVDAAMLAPRLLADARRIVGAPKVANIVFCAIQIAPLRPHESLMATDSAPSPPASPGAKSNQPL